MMTTIAIVPRMYTNIMDNPSQIVAGAPVVDATRNPVMAWLVCRAA
jgi:hypothetical protein